MGESFGSICYGSAVAVLLAAVLFAVGERARTMLRVPAPRSLRAAVDFGIGSWLVAMPVLAVGLAGYLRPAILGGIVVAAGAAGRWRRLPRISLGIAGYLAAGLPLLVVAAAPPFFYDSWVYHLGLPWQALADGALRAHPGNLFSTFPPLAQLLYAVPLGMGATRATGVLHLIAQCVAALATAGLARRLGASAWVARLAGLCALYLPVAPLVPGFPAAEAWTLGGIVTALALAATGRTGPRSSAEAGFAAGVAAAARVQGLPWGMIAGTIAVARSKRSFPAAGWFVGAMAAGSAPWWIKNAVLLHRPVAPLGWTAEGIGTLWADARSNFNLATSAADFLQRIASALSGRAIWIAPLVAAALAAALLTGRRATLWVATAAAAGTIAWAATGALDRFLVPSLVVAVAAAAAGATPSLPIGRLVAACALGLTLIPGVRGARTLLHEFGGLGMLGMPSEVYQKLVVSNPAPGFAACATLPKRSRVLFVSEPRGFLFPRAFETSSQHDRPSLTDEIAADVSPDRISARLTAEGFTHVLVNVAEIRRLGGAYPVAPWRDDAGRGRFVAFVDSLGPPVIKEGDIRVFVLPGAESGGAGASATGGDRGGDE